MAAHDYDDAGVSDGDIDLDDFTALTGCYAGPYVTPSQDCARPSRGKSLPDSGTYALHGRPVDVLSDGLVLVNFRARTYLPTHARFLQRDPTGYSDGNNLYEAFGSNPLRYVDPNGLLIEEILNLCLSGRFLSHEEIERGLAYGDVTLDRTRGALASDISNAFGSLIDPQALWRIPEGFQQGYRDPLIEATTSRFGSFINAQVATGADRESASSYVNLTNLFLSDLTGVTQLGEGVFGVDLATNEVLTTGESIRRSVQGGSTLIIIAAGPKAYRAARGRSAALVARGAEAAPVAVESGAPGALRARVSRNTAETSRGTACSKFADFAAKERALRISWGGAAPVLAGQAGVRLAAAGLESAGFMVRGSEITMEAAGLRTRIDLFVRAPEGGGLVPGTSTRVNPLQEFFVEVKTGPTARLSPNQRALFPEIREYGGIPRGARAAEAGLTVGKGDTPYEVIIIRP